MPGSADHEFGGQHTELKLSVIESYLKAYTRALRSKFEKLWYIDAFAGTGARTVRTEARGGDLLEEPVPEQIEQRRGSAQVAIDVTPPFDRIIFIESKAKYCAALRMLAAKHPTRDIAVVEEDANQSIRNAIAWDKWQSTRAALFLDPYGMQVHWDTLRAVAATHKMRYFFHLEDGACIRDPKGEEFPDDAAALLEAAIVARELSKARVHAYEWRVVVKNADGIRVGSVPLVPSAAGGAQGVPIPTSSIH